MGLADRLREAVEASGCADMSEAEFDYLDRDQRPYLHWDVLCLLRDAADALDTQQAALDARAADMGRMTQANLGRIKALEAGCAALARMQATQAAATQRLREVGHTTPQGHIITSRMCVDLVDAVAASPRYYVTPAGTFLTDADLDALTAEPPGGIRGPLYQQQEPAPDPG